MEFTIIAFIGGFMIALAVGFLTGIFGIGGGFLITPALAILLGAPMPVAVGTGMATFLVTSGFGMMRRRGSGTVDVKLALTIAAGSISGVFLGQNLIEKLDQMPPLTIRGQQVNTVEYVLLWAFVILLAWIAGFMFYDQKKNLPQSDTDEKSGLFARIKIPPYTKYSSLPDQTLPVIPLLLIGFCVGILSALLGVGGGVVLLPALIYLAGQRPAQAAGTSLLLVMISALIAVGLKWQAGQISIWLWAVMLVGGIVGTHVGTHVGLSINEHKIKKYFILVILAALMLIFVKIFQLTFTTPTPN